MRASWTGNLRLKVASLLLAALIWNFYRSERLSIRVFDVPLNFRNLPADLELTGEIPGSLTVRVEAPEALVRNLTPDRIDASVDLSSLSLGEQTIHVTSEELGVPSEAKVLRITPDRFSVIIERKMRRAIPIEPRVQGQVAPGHTLVRVDLFPANVEIEGPESEVSRSEKAMTDIIDVSDRSETFQLSVSLVPENTHVRLAGVHSVIATVEIRESPAEGGLLEGPVRGEDAEGVVAGAAPVPGRTSPYALAAAGGPRSSHLPARATRGDGPGVRGGRTLAGSPAGAGSGAEAGRAPVVLE